MSVKTMLPYLNLASAVINQARIDARSDDIVARENAEWFLSSEWGKYLEDNCSMFYDIINNDFNKMHV